MSLVIQIAGLVSGLSNDGENEEEKVDNVQVKVQRSEDVFFWRQRVFVLSSHHHLSVEHQVLQKRDRTSAISRGLQFSNIFVLQTSGIFNLKLVHNSRQ